MRRVADRITFTLTYMYLLQSPKVQDCAKHCGKSRAVRPPLRSVVMYGKSAYKELILTMNICTL